MKCSKCQREGHRARDCHKFPPPAPEWMEEDEEARQDFEDSVQPFADVIVDCVRVMFLEFEGRAMDFHYEQNKKMEEKLESRFHATNELVKSLRSLLVETNNHLIRQDMQISGLAEKLNGTNSRLEKLTAENRALQAEVARMRPSFSAPSQQPPPPPPQQDTLHPTTPPPQPKRKRNLAVGATPRKPPKQPRDTSPPLPDAEPSSPSPMPAPKPPTTDQGWTEVKKKRSKGGKNKGKSGEQAQAPKGRSGGRKAPTWAQVVQGGGVHVTVYYGSGDPKPSTAGPPKRRRNTGKERKANGSGSEKRKEMEGNKV